MAWFDQNPLGGTTSAATRSSSLSSLRGLSPLFLQVDEVTIVTPSYPTDTVLHFSRSASNQIPCSSFTSLIALWSQLITD